MLGRVERERDQLLAKSKLSTTNVQEKCKWNFIAVNVLSRQWIYSAVDPRQATVEELYLLKKKLLGLETKLAQMQSGSQVQENVRIKELEAQLASFQVHSIWR